MSREVVVVFTTWPDLAQARMAARVLVVEQLAACGNIVPAVESIYRWEGNVETASEVLAIFKTTQSRYPEFELRVKSLHPYDVPEILCLPAAAGWPPYLQWVAAGCAARPAARPDAHP